MQEDHLRDWYNEQTVEDLLFINDLNDGKWIWLDFFVITVED